MNLLLAALLIFVTGLVFLTLLVVVPRRLLGLQIGLIRALIAAIVGNAVWFAAGQVLFKSDSGQLPLTLLTVQVGLALLGAMAFLAVAEAAVPSGAGLRVVNWKGAGRRKLGRGRRYVEVVTIALRHGLLSTRRRRRASSDVDERRALGRSLRLALEEGGVTFIKLGQLLSTRRDLVPPELTDELVTLTDAAPPVAWEQIECTLHEELGPAVFAHVDPQPLAAASIAQVHAATLPSGEAVVVKVQRPQIGPLIERDVDILSRIARSLEARSQWARSVGAVELANGFASAISEELDFRIEARNMAAVALSAARRTGDAAAAVRVPVPTAALCTRRVLVMERLDGTPIGSAALFDGHDVDRASLARTLLHFVLTQIMLDGVFHADPHPGNVLLLDDGRIGLLDFGSVGRLDPTVRSALQQLFVALEREDPAAARDALLEILIPSADVDEQRLERALGRFMAHHLGPSATNDAQLFTDLFRLVPEHGLSVPPEVAAVFRCLTTLEGTLTQIDPSFDIVNETRAYAAAI